MGSDDPTAPVWADTIEALVEADDIAHARHVFAQWEQRANQQGGPWALAATSRCRALLAAVDRNFDAAGRAFSESLAALDGFTYPLERARTLLCMGSVLRQAQQRGAARDALQQALTIFEELGGRLWADKARAELARISGRRAPSEVLTGTERQVAELAGTGQSNREIAASLHMGVSTVESHLSNVYRKLNVKRAELATALTVLPT
jgi:DNA-binding CsgD family transcriptional regulator